MFRANRLNFTARCAEYTGFSEIIAHKGDSKILAKYFPLAKVVATISPSRLDKIKQ